MPVDREVLKAQCEGQHVPGPRTEGCSASICSLVGIPSPAQHELCRGRSIWSVPGPVIPGS